MNITTESLRNGLHFPSFRSTPHENDIDESYYTIQPNMVYHPKKHWCFFGEIKSLSNFNRLRLEVQDSNGDVIPVAFHMQRPGMRIFTPDMTVYSEIQKYNVKFKVGHTFAYLYAQQHDFLDGSCGFRIEEEGHFKVIPFSLDSLFAANDRIVAQQQPGYEPSCFACEKKLTGTLRCGRCNTARYCNKECQTASWNNGHKEECKLFREVQWFIKRDWDDYDHKKLFKFS